MRNAAGWKFDLYWKLSNQISRSINRSDRSHLSIFLIRFVWKSGAAQKALGNSRKAESRGLSRLMFQFDQKVGGGIIMECTNSKTLLNPGNKRHKCWNDQKVGGGKIMKYTFQNTLKSRQQGSRPKCWIDRLQAVRRIEQATTRLRCSPWMEYQYQAKGKPSEKRAANEISRKLAYLSSSGINFVALMSSAPLLRQRKRSTQALLCSIWGYNYPGPIPLIF